MKKFKVLLVFGFLAVNLPALADCPINMEYNELLDCIVVEGSGASFPQAPASENSIHDQDERE